MLRSYKSDNVDQRAPAPPGMHNVLRGEAEANAPHSSSPVKQHIHSTHAQHTHLSQGQHPQGQQLQVQLYQSKPTIQPQYMQPQPVQLPKQHVQSSLQQVRAVCIFVLTFFGLTGL